MGLSIEAAKKYGANLVVRTFGLEIPNLVLKSPRDYLPSEDIEEQRNQTLAKLLA